MVAVIQPPKTREEGDIHDRARRLWDNLEVKVIQPDNLDGHVARLGNLLTG